jgi:GNAT superfamily N-acetyltransferase
MHLEQYNTDNERAASRSGSTSSTSSSSIESAQSNSPGLGPSTSVHTRDLPHNSSPSLVLSPTTPSERHLQLTLNGASWRGALSLPSYILREEHLANQDCHKDGGLTSWALVDSLDPKLRRVLCGCETYRKKALVAKKIGAEREVKEVTVYGIGSVFCPKEFRGMGYAGRLMKDVAKRVETEWSVVVEGLDENDEGEATPFSMLFSDIGKQFYKSLGWEPYPSMHLSIPAREIHQHKATLPTCAKVKRVFAEDIEELCKLDESQLKRSLTSSTSSQDTLVALTPRVETMRWHHAREEFVGQDLLGEAPIVKGAIVGVEGQRTWCIWTRMWYNPDAKSAAGNTLYILRIVAEGINTIDWEKNKILESEAQQQTDQVVKLLEIANEEASRWGCERVEIWNPNEVVIQAGRLISEDAILEERSSLGIPSLRWHGQQPKDGVAWISNEKYAWC